MTAALEVLICLHCCYPQVVHDKKCARAIPHMCARYGTYKDVNSGLFSVPCRQLKVLAPNHPIVKRWEAGEEAFVQAAASMA